MLECISTQKELTTCLDAQLTATDFVWLIALLEFPQLKFGLTAGLPDAFCKNIGHFHRSRLHS